MPREIDARSPVRHVALRTPDPITPTANPTTPNTTRIGGLIARAPAHPINRSPASLRDGEAAARLLTDKLSYDVFDWAVTHRELRASLEALRGLDEGALATVVDRVDPKLLSRLAEKASGRLATTYADTLERLAAARNAPSPEPQDVDATELELARTLDGFLVLDLVDEDEARQAIDRLRALGPADRERVLDSLGPSKTYRMIDNLSKADRATFAPTIAAAKRTFFGWMLRESQAIGLGPKDTTPDLTSLLADVAAGRAEHPADLGDYVYFAVPGLVTEHQPGYFDANVEHLEALGLEVARSQIDTDADVEVNAAQLRHEIQDLAARTGKKVVVLSHSKGGPDAAEALQDEATEACCHRFIAMQPAMATPVASTLMRSNFGDVIRDAFTDVLGASTGEALAHLGFGPAKARFLKSRPLAVKTLTLASTVGEHFSTLRPVADLMRDRYGADSDGLVTLDEQFVPGQQAFRAVLDGVDHTAPCSRPLPGTPALRYDQGVLTEALVLLALRL